MKLKTAFLIAVVLIFFYTALTAASTGRFARTHAIVAQSNCTDCHPDALISLDKGKHTGAMGQDQSIIIDYYGMMRGDGDINGLCFSCHNVRYREFGVMDPYVSGNRTAINGIVFWNHSAANGSESENASVNIAAQTILPNTSTATVDATILLMNFTGHQNSTRISTNVIQSLAEGENVTLSTPDVYGDYYRVFISVSGSWNSSTLNVTVNGYPSILINSTNGSGTNYYALPPDFPSEYSWLQYFHTNGSYTMERMDSLISRMQNASVTSISFNELMYDNFTNTSRYTCSTPDTMCHINIRLTDMGQTYGVSGEKYYSHALGYTTTGLCNNCHLY